MEFWVWLQALMLSFTDLRIAPMYVVSTIAIAALIYLFTKRSDRQGSFLGWLFPKSIYFHPSHYTDIKLFIFNQAAKTLGLFGALGLQTAMAVAVLTGLNKLTGNEVVSGTWTFEQMALVTLVMMVANDFCVYWIHRIHHEWPVLWPFHAVHHSAEVMTPITVYRKHPIYDVFGSFFKAFVRGSVLGLVVFCLTDTYSTVEIAGISAAYFLFNILGANLRHSHIWLGYGKVLSHIFISPAQHQIHHSIAVKHHNKNYGEVLAIWDWMFGTLYVPETREQLTYGIGDENGERLEQPHKSLTDALLVPFEDSWKAVKERQEAAQQTPRPTEP
ncbi:MAG: sterol desaturase family protein [Pseudomonadota bacterium]